MSQQAQYRDPETEAAKSNSTIKLNLYTTAFHTATGQNVISEKGGNPT